jgi:hypothetical protein
MTSTTTPVAPNRKQQLRQRLLPNVPDSNTTLLTHINKQIDGLGRLAPTLLSLVERWIRCKDHRLTTPMPSLHNATLLMAVAYCGNVKAVELLVGYARLTGADFASHLALARDANRLSTLHYIVLSHQGAKVEMIELLFALVFGNEATMMHLLSLQEGSGYTALTLASELGLGAQSKRLLWHARWGTLHAVVSSRPNRLKGEVPVMDDHRAAALLNIPSTVGAARRKLFPHMVFVQPLQRKSYDDVVSNQIVQNRVVYTVAKHATYLMLAVYQGKWDIVRDFAAKIKPYPTTVKWWMSARDANGYTVFHYVVATEFRCHIPSIMRELLGLCATKQQAERMLALRDCIHGSCRTPRELAMHLNFASALDMLDGGSEWNAYWAAPAPAPAPPLPPPLPPVPAPVFVSAPRPPPPPPPAVEEDDGEVEFVGQEDALTRAAKRLRAAEEAGEVMDLDGVADGVASNPLCVG